MFSHNLLSSHVLRLKIAVCGTKVYRMGIPEIVEQILQFLLAQSLIKSCFPVRNYRLRDRNLSYRNLLKSSNNSWNFFSDILLSSHVLRLEIAVCGAEVYRIGIPGISSRTSSYQVMFSC